MESEKSLYLQRRTEILQNSVVNVKCATTSTIESYTWTFRTTACDVISMITTTVPLKNGTIKELSKTHNKETRRVIKTPLRKPGTFLSVHPLEEKFVHNEDAVRLRKNEALWSEHKTFFKKLQISRYLRSTVEALAATYIQKAYRGYYTRTRKDELIESCLYRKRIRTQIRDYIIAHSEMKGLGMVLTQGEHRKRFKEWRYQAASFIQRGFRCFYSRKRVKRVRIEMGKLRKLRALTRIQCFFRSVMAIRRISHARSVKLTYMRTRGARLMQSIFRCLLARRRVSRRRYKLRWLAARMIQCCYRFYKVNVLLKLMRQRVISVKTYNASLVIQCLARQRISFFRVASLAYARLKHRVRSYSSIIQARMRGYLGRALVKKMKIEYSARKRLALVAKLKGKRNGSNLDIVNFLPTTKSAKNSQKSSQKSIEPLGNDLDISRKHGSQKGQIVTGTFKSESPLILVIQKHDLHGINTILSGLSGDEKLNSVDAVNALTAAVLSFMSGPLGIQVVTLLLDMGLSAYINDAHKESGSTVLQLASQLGYRNVVELLLSYYADKSVTDISGHTALHQACCPIIPNISSIKMVHLLLGIEGNSDGTWDLISRNAGGVPRNKTMSNSEGEYYEGSASEDIGLSVEIPDQKWELIVGREETLLDSPMREDDDPLSLTSMDEGLGGVGGVGRVGGVGGVNGVDGVSGDSEGRRRSMILPSPKSRSQIKRGRELHTIRMVSELSLQSEDGKDCLLIAAIAGQTEVLEFARMIVKDAKIFEVVIAEEMRVAEVARVEKERIQRQEEAEAQLEAEELQALELEAYAAAAAESAFAAGGQIETLGGVGGMGGDSLLVSDINDADNLLTISPKIIGEDGFEIFQGEENTVDLMDLCDDTPNPNTTISYAVSYVKEERVQCLRPEIMTEKEAIWYAATVKTFYEDGAVSVIFDDGNDSVIPEEGIATRIRKIDSLEKFQVIEILVTPVISEKEKSLKEIQIPEKVPVPIVTSIPPIAPVVPKVVTRRRVSWTEVDVLYASELSKKGNLECLAQLFDEQYDTSLVDKNGMTLEMIAAKEGHLPILNLLLSQELDFSVRDNQSRTVMHYAAMCTNEDVIVYLLTHEKTKICKMDEKELVVQDIEGSTPLHIAAQRGVSLFLDLLAPRGIELALVTRDLKGLTPLLVACSHSKKLIIKSYLSLGADATAVDNVGHGALWHLYHPIEASATDRPFASEYVARVKEGNILLLSASEVSRVAAEVDIVVCLLRAGCPFFSTPYSLQADSSIDPRSIECADVANKELSVTLFKTIPRLLSSVECWRLVLSSIRYYDDINARMFSSLMTGGAAEIMILEPKVDYSSDVGHQIFQTLDPERNPPKSFQIISELAPYSNRGIEGGGGEGSGVVGGGGGKMSVLDLENIFFSGFTIGGWAVKLGSIQVTEFILNSGYDIMKPADILGNNLIHLAAKYGDKLMVETVCIPRKHKIDFEAENLYGFTPIMEGARSGNREGVKCLISFGGNARRGLDGKYCAWLLVLISREEKDKKKKSERSEKKNSINISPRGEDAEKIALLNFQKLQKNKAFVMNNFDINLIRRKTRKLLENGDV